MAEDYSSKLAASKRKKMKVALPEQGTKMNKLKEQGAEFRKNQADYMKTKLRKK